MSCFVALFCLSVSRPSLRFSSEETSSDSSGAPRSCDLFECDGVIYTLMSRQICTGARTELIERREGGCLLPLNLLPSSSNHLAHLSDSLRRARFLNGSIKALNLFAPDTKKTLKPKKISSFFSFSFFCSSAPVNEQDYW